MKDKGKCNAPNFRRLDEPLEKETCWHCERCYLDISTMMCFCSKYDQQFEYKDAFHYKCSDYDKEQGEEDRKARQCKACKHWVFTETIGSKDKPVWHCRHGFTPSKDCREMADYNDKCKDAYYRKHPEDLQLSFNF